MIGTVFLVIALVCFLLGAANIPAPRINLVALGLAFWVLSILIGGMAGGHLGLR